MITFSCHEVNVNCIVSSKMLVLFLGGECGRCNLELKNLRLKYFNVIGTNRSEYLK